LVFARLLPMTLIALPLVFNPLTPLYNALEIPIEFSFVFLVFTAVL
jgi:hypothetical protein